MMARFSNPLTALCHDSVRVGGGLAYLGCFRRLFFLRLQIFIENFHQLVNAELIGVQQKTLNASWLRVR